MTIFSSRIRQSWITGRRRRRQTVLITTRFLRLFLWGDLARIYTWILTLPTLFAGFWVVAVLYVQLSDPKQVTLQVFPNGLNDAAALIPLALGGFSALLFSAQGSVPSGTRQHLAYGQAARRLLVAFYYLGLSFILGTGSRIARSDSFTGWQLDWVLNPLAALLPALMYINALIALLLILSGLAAFVRTILNDR